MFGLADVVAIICALLRIEMVSTEQLVFEVYNPETRMPEEQSCNLPVEENPASLTT